MNTTWGGPYEKPHAPHLCETSLVLLVDLVLIVAVVDRQPLGLHPVSRLVLFIPVLLEADGQLLLLAGLIPKLLQLLKPVDRG